MAFGYQRFIKKLQIKIIRILIPKLPNPAADFLTF